MQAIKNLIARRRPSDGAGATPADPQPGTRPASRARPTPKGASASLERAPSAAKPVPEHLPAPPRPKVAQVSDWVRRPRTAQSPASTVETPPAPELKIWDIDPQETPSPTPDIPTPGIATATQRVDPVPPDQPAAPAPKPTSNRTKTRLLGFAMDGATEDIFTASPVEKSANTQFPIGWLIVVEGPGRGASFTLTAGLSTVGRDADQTVSLDFGDATISRQNHIAIAYDEEENRTFVGHGGKANIVRLNDTPLLTTEDLNDGDRIKIGKTELKFVAFCTADFHWGSVDGAEEAHD